MSLTRSLDMIAARVPRWKINWYVTLDSTQLEAQRLLAQNCPDRTVVVAMEQTAGMGRLGRTWHSSPGEGLYFSFVWRLGLPPRDMPAYTLALGLAVKAAIEQVADVPCDLKWPNDVWIGHRKVCGILTQLQDSAVIAGIGVNIGHREFPPELESIATSLRREGAVLSSSEDLFVALLDSIEDLTMTMLELGREPILKLFGAASSFVWGRRVVAEHEGALVRGVTQGLDDNGFLVLRKDDGSRVTILAGQVRPE